MSPCIDILGRMYVSYLKLTGMKVLYISVVLILLVLSYGMYYYYLILICLIFLNSRLDLKRKIGLILMCWLKLPPLSIWDVIGSYSYNVRYWLLVRLSFSLIFSLYFFLYFWKIRGYMKKSLKYIFKKMFGTRIAYWKM